MGLRVSLVGPVHGREFERVPNKKDRLFELSTHAYCKPPLGGPPTVLLKTKSWFPSSVYIFMAHPCTSRVVSAEPASGPTVDTRRRTGVFLPTWPRKLADVMSEQSSVAVNSP